MRLSRDQKKKKIQEIGRNAEREREQAKKMTTQNEIEARKENEVDGEQGRKQKGRRDEGKRLTFQLGLQVIRGEHKHRQEELGVIDEAVFVAIKSAENRVAERAAQVIAIQKGVEF